MYHISTVTEKEKLAEPCLSEFRMKALSPTSLMGIIGHKGIWIECLQDCNNLQKENAPTQRQTGGIS